MYYRIMLKKFRSIILLLIVSTIIQFYCNDFRLSNAIGGIVFQFIASGLLGWVFTQYYNKYFNSSRITWWARFYTLMIIGTIVVYFLGI